MHVLVTGAAGFIGFHLSRRLLMDGHTVVGLDIVNDYYSVTLKHDRLKILHSYPAFLHEKVDLNDMPKMQEIFQRERFTHVVNLAAQAGVRYSIRNPRAYVDSNIVGFFNILECCRQYPVEHLVFASSSSVYGLNTRMPFSVHDNVDHPLSLYAASKKSNELMAHSYSHLYRIPCTGLRFFTVYGPWGRPDMALFIFTKAMLENKPIPVFNHGKMKRDFTYIDDILAAIVHVLKEPASPNPAWNSDRPDPSSSLAPYRLYNIGNNQTVELSTYIQYIEQSLQLKANIQYLPMQPGDVPATCADIDDLARDFNFRPSTPVSEGIPRFIEWYLDYYGRP